MKLIQERTLHTPYGAHYVQASQSGDVMTVDYFTIAKQPIVHVNMPARIMEKTAYEKMVKVKDPAAAVKVDKTTDAHDVETARKERSDLPYGKELSKGEEEAEKLKDDALKNPKGSSGEEDDEYFMIDIDVPEAKEPGVNVAPSQKMNESLRQAKEDDVFTAKQIRQAMTELSEFDDENVRDQFIAALGNPVDINEEEVSNETFDRLYTS